MHRAPDPPAQFHRLGQRPCPASLQNDSVSCVSKPTAAAFQNRREQRRIDPRKASQPPEERHHRREHRHRRQQQPHAASQCQH